MRGVMSMDGKEENGCDTEPLISKDGDEVENQGDDGEEEEESESNSLLAPRKGGMSRKSEKVRKSVQWNDNNGHKLAEILVFEPSDADSDDEDSDACICIVM